MVDIYMSDGVQKGQSGFAPWQLAVAVIGVMLTAFSVWGSRHPAGSSQSNFQNVYNTIVSNSGNRTIFNNGSGSSASIADSSSPAVAVGAQSLKDGALPSSTTPPTAAPADVAFVPMQSNSLDAGGIGLASARSAHVVPGEGSRVHLLLKATSSRADWKIFVMPVSYSLVGWNLTTESGTSCNVENNLNGIQTIPTPYTDHVQEMLTLHRGTSLISNLLANCDHQIQPNDKFHLLARIFTLPATATPDSPDSRNANLLNFSSVAIPRD
jgi:hypothetical protein